MTIEIKAPALPESVPDGTVSNWHKNVGDQVFRDEALVDIETDKVVIEVVSPADGVLEAILRNPGDTIVSNETIGRVAEAELEPGSAPPEPASTAANAAAETKTSPAARKLIEERDLDAARISGSGKDGRITKEDVLNHPSPATTPRPPASVAADGRIEERVPMSRLRARVAERLLHASQSTAMLTTFNEVNMQPVMQLRERFRAEFEKAHDGVRLGFMAFFVRACTEALKRFPVVNASIDGDDVVYHGYQDIGVAVSSPRGLVVPVLRNADNLGLAQIEKAIGELSEKARNGNLAIEDMTGGTFTVSNGGVFGSLLSTPILNPPQTAILGMHRIQERPVAVRGEVRILPMMYLALSYDHRLIDGKEAVQFLGAVRDFLEEPVRMLLEI